MQNFQGKKCSYPRIVVPRYEKLGYHNFLLLIGKSLIKRGSKEAGKMETKIPERDVKFISIQFTNLQGKLRNMEYTRSAFEEIKNTGTRFDGSSLGFATVQESDLILLPEESTFQRFPWNRQVGRVFATVAHPNQEAFQADPRRILMRVSDNLREGHFGIIRGY